MSRRKHLAVRKPSGQTRMQMQLTPPAEVKRLREAALAGMRSAEWGTMLGRMYLEDKITSVQFSVGKRWADLVAEYSEACCSPRAPRSAKLDADGGSVLDPDSAKGRREVRRHERMVESYLDGVQVLNRAGRMVAFVVKNVCVMDLAPAGFNETEALRVGLQALAAFWSKQK